MEATSNEEASELLATDSTDKEITGPFILSCSKCKTIVGDSFSLLKVDGEMRTVTLTAASNIQRSADVYTSKEGLDVGSTFFRFTCAVCQNPLGLYYLTTSKDLDDLREKFSFSYESVTLYEVGKAQHGVDNPVPFNTSDPSAPAAEDGEESSSSHSNGLNLKEPTNKEEIGRIKHVLTGALAKISVLESSLLAKISVLESSLHKLMNFVHHRPPGTPQQYTPQAQQHTPQAVSQMAAIAAHPRIETPSPHGNVTMSKISSMPRHHEDSGQKRLRS